MNFTTLLERIHRESNVLKNKIFRQDNEKIELLFKLFRHSPRGNLDAQDWAKRCAELIESNILDRISKKDIALILAGLVSYKNTGVTPQISHMALVRAYENSSGLMQDLLHNILYLEKIQKDLKINSIFFGEINQIEIDLIQKELDEQGYAILPWRLDQSWIDAIVREAGNFRYTLKDQGNEGIGIPYRKIDLANPPDCVAAFANPVDLTQSKLLSDLSNDSLFINIASQYLSANAKPIGMSLWYSFASKTPSSEAAQLFHYDLDTLRFLKVFVYLTDVGPNNGPHEYVPASHKPGAKPQALMDRVYGRLQDSEIDLNCPQGRRTIYGPSGTVILGDTNCFHKGNAVISDCRLIFSPIYAASRIGFFHGE